MRGGFVRGNTEPRDGVHDRAGSYLGFRVPQGSKSAVLIGGKARLIEGSSTTGREKHKSWRQGSSVKLAATTSH